MIRYLARFGCCVLLTSAASLHAAQSPSTSWFEVAPSRSIHTNHVHAVEVVREGEQKYVTLALEGERVTTSSAAAAAAVDALVSDTKTWLGVKGENVGGLIIKRYARRSSILSVQFSCPNQTTCAVYLGGEYDVFSSLVVDTAAGIAELKKVTTGGNVFILLENPKDGFETFVRRAAIRSVRFVCSQPNVCSQADLKLSSATVRIVRDAGAIARLRELVSSARTP
jgi:hypothetical protein